MPSITLTIGGKPQTVTVDRLPTTHDELDEIIANAPGVAGAAPPADESPGWFEGGVGPSLSRAADYAKQKITDWGDAAQRLGMDVAGALPGSTAVQQAVAAGAPAPDPNRSWWNTGGDILTTLGTVAAPELTLAGTAVGAGMRAADFSPETSSTVDALTQLGLGGVQVGRAISASRQAGAATTVAKSLAGEAPEAAPKIAGEALETAVPAATREAAQAARAETYAPAKTVANLPGPPAPGTTGFVAAAENPLGQRLYHGLSDLLADQGETMSRGERQAANNVIDAITGGKTSAGKPITPDYDFLDKQLRIAKKGGMQVKGVTELIEGALQDMLKGTPAEGLREAGAEAWKPITATREALQKPIIRAARKADPITAFKVVGGSYTNASKAELARDLLAENHPDVWSKVNQGFYGQIFQNAGGDAKKAGAIWGKIHPDVKAVFDPDGIADQAFQRMAKWQKAGSSASWATKPLVAATAMYKLVRGDPWAAGEILFAGHELPLGKMAGQALKGAEYGGPTAARAITSAAVPAQKVLNAGPSGDPLLDAAEKASQGGGVESTTGPATPGAAPPPADTGAERGPAYPSPAFRDTGAETPPARPTPARPAAAPRQPSTYPRSYGGAWNREIGAIARVTGIPENLMRVVIHRESSGNPRALAPDGGRGLMQLMPATFRAYAPRIERITGRPANIDDPIDNMVAGALHLRDDLDATGGSVRRAAKRYNSGHADSLHPAVIDYGNDVARRFAFLERQGRG